MVSTRGRAPARGQQVTEARHAVPARTVPEQGEPGLVRLQRLAGNRATATLVVQRRRLGEVGATSEGSSLNVDGGAFRAPGQAGYSQLLSGAATQMAEEMAASGDLSGLTLANVAPQLGGLPALQNRWLARKREAERQLGDLLPAPPSIERMLARTRDGAQQQLDAIAVSRDELLVRTAHFNSLVPRANTFVTSAARLSSMQALLGATDNESLAAALVTGMQEATAVAANYQDAFRSGSRSASEADLMPSEDNTLTEATDQVDAKARSLSTAYREFRVTQMQDMIAALTASGSEDRDRLAAIESTKRSIAQIAQTIDLAMAIVAPEGAATILSPTTSIEDAVKKQVTDAMPSVGGVIRFIADVAYDAEIRRINERLRSLDSLIASERAAINRQEYERRREAFTGALINYRNAQTALRNRIEARRRAYLELGERLDRFARVRGSSSGARVGAGQERFSTIFTLVSGVRETLGLARWGNSVVDETGLGPAQLRAWYHSVTGSPRPSGAEHHWRASGLTDGEVQMLSPILRQVSGFQAATQTAVRLFGPVDAAAAQFMGSPALRPGQGSGDY